MIKSIVAGEGITVNGGYLSWPTFYNNTNSNTLVGQLRYNGSSQHLEVYDGTSWLILQPAHPTVQLGGDVQEILKWAKFKMLEEQRIRDLASKHPTVADAVAALKLAEEQVQIVAALVETE